MNRLIAFVLTLVFAFCTILVFTNNANYGAIIFGSIFGAIVGINIDKDKVMELLKK